MSAHQRDSIFSIDDLLARIRSCITTCPTEAVISLTINTGAASETTLFHLSVQADGGLVPVLAEEPSSSSLQDLLVNPHLSNDKDDTEMGIAEQLVGDSGFGEGEDHPQVRQDEGDAPKATPPCSADSTTLPTAPSTSPSTNIRRSARPQHPPDRLLYLAAASKRATGTSEKRRADPEDTTDGSDSPSSPAASSTDDDDDDDDDKHLCAGRRQRSPSKKLKRQHHHHEARRSISRCSDVSEDEQVAALVTKLREACSRQQQAPALESASKEAVLQLGRDILGEERAGEGSAELDFQRCAVNIDRLISTSTAMRMLGYYLRGALATRLKRSHKNKYVRSARAILGLKSSADITACPAFYAFVHEHCPSVATCTGAVADIEALLREPIFLADIGWSEWRKYLGKTSRWMVDAAMKQFRAAQQPSQDWMELHWVEEYDDPTLGRGVRAVRDIPLPLGRHDGSAVAADLSRFTPTERPQGHVQGTTSTQWYRIEWQGGKQALDAERFWVGKINHLPMSHCNLKLVGNGKLVQRRAIVAGEALSFDYGVQWWTHRVTGLAWNEWMTLGTLARRKGAAELFHRMHESVSDYSPLLSKGWDQRLSEATREVEREAVIMEMWQAVAPVEEQDREMQL